MKKLISVLLAVLMLVCIAPFASAEENEIVTDNDGVAYIHAEDHLLNMGYGDIETRTELAVGDTLEVWYFDTFPGEVYIDGEKVYELPDSGREFFYYPLKQTGTVEISVRRGGKTLETRSFTVITSSEMYKKVVQDAFRYAADTLRNTDPFPPAEELEEAAHNGFPVGHPMLPFAYAYMLITNLMHALLSFVRIVH